MSAPRGAALRTALTGAMGLAGAGLAGAQTAGTSPSTAPTTGAPTAGTRTSGAPVDPGEPAPGGGAPFAVSAGVRAWPTPAGAARGPAVAVHARHALGPLRLRGDAAVADRASPGAAAGPRLLDWRLTVGTAPARLGPLRADAAAGAERDAFDPRATWTQYGAQLRAWAGGARGGAWAGAFAPRAARATPTTTELRGGAWAVRGDAVFSVALRQVATGGLVEIGRDSGFIDAASCRSARVGGAPGAPGAARTVCRARSGSLDAHVGVAWLVGAGEVRLRAGERLSARGPSGGARERWAGAGVTLPPVGPFALALDVARQPPDVVRGIPGSTRAFAGVRWALGARRAPSPPAPGPPDVVRAAPGARAGARTLAFALGAAGSAELRGSFTDWRAVPLRRAADGTWQAEVALPPGVHTLAVRVDGGPWRAPPGLPAADDGFGGEVGTLVVEPPPA